MAAAVLRLVALAWLSTGIVACAPEVLPTAKLDSTGILLVDVGELVQAFPQTETMRLSFSRATELAEANGNDLGYPWIDPSSGELVQSASTPLGREIIEGTNIGAPYRLREVKHGVHELRRIQDEVTQFRAQGIPGAELIFMTMPDHRDNRALVVVSAMSRQLLDALADRYPVDALAVQIYSNAP